MILVGVALLLVLGLTLLPSTVEGTFTSESASDPAVAGVYSVEVRGRAWLIAGTVLVGFGTSAAALVVARFRRSARR